MAGNITCPQCGKRHPRFILELRLFEVTLGGGTRTVTCYRADQITEAVAALVDQRARFTDPDFGPVGFGLDAWVVDANTGDAEPFDDESYTNPNFLPTLLNAPST